MQVNGFYKYSADEGDTKDKTCFKCGVRSVWFLKFHKNKDAGVCVCNGKCLKELEQKQHPECAGCGFPKDQSSYEENLRFLFNRNCGINSCGSMLFSHDPIIGVFHGQHPFFAPRLKAPRPEEKKQQFTRPANQRTLSATTAATTAATGQRTFADAFREPKPAEGVPQVPMSPEQKEHDAKRQEQEKTNNELRAKIEANKQKKLACEQFALEMQKLKKKEDELRAELAQLEAELNAPNSSAP